MKGRAAVLLLLLALAPAARGAEYDNLVEKGEFFLQKGAAYVPDAVRALEQAAEADAGRAGSDPRLAAALAGAYVRVYRYSEAYRRLEELHRAGRGDDRTAALLDYLLNEAGVGRLHLGGALPVTRFTASFEAKGGAPLDVAGRKVLEHLNEYLARPLDLGPEGRTLLLPEGRFLMRSSAPFDASLATEREIEVWAGDEKSLALVAAYPPPGGFRVRPGNRVVSLAWPAAAGASYRLTRIVPGAGAEETRYEGGEPAFVDRQVPLGGAVRYRLRVFGADGGLIGFSEVSATAQPPVGAIAVDAVFQGNLTVDLSWALGEGSVDRMTISRSDGGEEKNLADLRGADVIRIGEAVDGPVELAPFEQPLIYRIAAWVEGEPAPTARAEKTLIVPPMVARIEEVAQSLGPDRVTVEWSTFPRDGLAQGYAVYRVGAQGVLGELVGRVDNAHAREFSYVPAVEPRPEWRHFVLPYLGERFLVLPEKVTAVAEEPRQDFDRRALRARGNPLPDLALSWQPRDGARSYVIRSGEQELLIDKTYVEMGKLQSNLFGAEHAVEVLAVLPDGKREKILAVDLRYNHYPRP